ncbi:MAG TPA: SDR family NAD(P)-dependent oxidoreductase [Solirubrobacterales bacterium]|nr:SDR family NAD(P)-dependent oxidoreductase [Solirubrobacterales bacterium]
MAPTAVITGASSGIGAATARALAGAGYRTVLGARRLDRLQELAAEIGGEAIELDVTDSASVAELVRGLPGCDVLINNAGGALGLDHIGETEEELWRQMYEANVMGTMRMTRALLPLLVASGNGHVVTVTSIAAFEIYRGGAGYVAAKHAQSAVARTLRLELLGSPVRVTEILPGMVETEFSLVRFDGDPAAADAVYERMTPLLAEDVAESIRWAVELPDHVNVDQIVLRPRDQASATEVHRRADP